MSSTAAPAPVAAPGTRTDFVDARLRQAILSGELAPGTRLVAKELAARWAVSATPLREAFGRLAGEGLVELRPQRGAWVTPASVQDARDVYELRILLEPEGLRASLERADAAMRDAIGATHATYERALRAGDLAASIAAHRAFHAALLSRCPNARLLELVDSLAEHSQRYQVLAVGAPGGHYDVIAEHRTLRDRALAGDVDGAVAFLEDHLRQTFKALTP
ncbi:MAG: GntR family transcriptional regulator [Actinobacteria bacterium]|nr:GntR family transcriptional regulator [Actinomycetota bacterium]